MAQFARFRSMCDHSTNHCGFVVVGVGCLLCHLKSGFRIMINKYGLSIYLWIVPLLMGGVVPKCFLINDVVELVYMLPTNLTASRV